MTSVVEMAPQGLPDKLGSVTGSDILSTHASDEFSDLSYAKKVKDEVVEQAMESTIEVEVQPPLDETVRPYLDRKNKFTYYESNKSSKAAKVKASPAFRNSEEGEASATDDGTPPVGVVDSDAPLPPPTSNGVKPIEEATSGKYPFPEFVPLQNFEEFFANAADLTYEDLYKRTQIVTQTMMDLQGEWDEVDKECYDWEEAEKAKSKAIADEAKAQAELEQADEDARILILQTEYRDELRLSRKEWQDVFTKQHLEAVENDTAEAQAEAQLTLDLLNKIRDPLFMKGFQRRQRALISQKWDSRLVEKPLPETKQTKEERDLEERKRKRLTDRITFDDMNRADAYGYTYNALDLSRGDQKLPNLRVIAKAKDNKRNIKHIEVNGDSSRPKRNTRKGVVSESGENSEAASATEEEPLPEKRRGRGQTTKFVDTINSAAEAGKKSAKTYVGEDGVRRYVGSNKPSGRPAATAAPATKGKGKAAPRSKLDQMSRAVSESDDPNGNKRKASDDDEYDAPPRAKRTKTPGVPSHQPPMYFPPPPLAPVPVAILPSINSMLNPEPPVTKTMTKRKRAAETITVTPSGETAENTDEDISVNGKPTKKPRNKTDQERAIQSAAMKLNWSNPNGKMRMGIERRNRRAARKKTETQRLKNGGAPNDNVIYKSDEEGFSYAYFGETPPVANPNPGPMPFQQASASASASAAPSAAATTATNTPVTEDNAIFDDFHTPTSSQNTMPVKKTRTGRVSKPTMRTYAGFDGAADEDDEDDEEYGSDESTEPLYQTFQKIISPGHDLGKRVSRPRMQINFGSSTDEDGEGEVEDERDDTDA